MSRITLIVLLLMCFFGARPQVQAKADDAYLVFYATHAGKTGHVGLAIDKQRVRVLDCATCPDGVRYDTVATGELIYFDLWPADDDYTYAFFFGEVAAKYCRLPTSSAETPITVGSLQRRGLPHAMRGGADGLARIITTPTQDAALEALMQEIVDSERPFNLYEFNCSDFVATGLRSLIPDLHVAEERVLHRMATTPNRLWKSLANVPGVVVLKDPGEKAAGRFNAQRIFSSLKP